MEFREDDAEVNVSVGQSEEASAHVVPTGIYRVCNVAAATTGLSRDTSKIEQLAVGAYVDVVETQYVPAEDRVRGRIRAGVGLTSRWSSDGWIKVLKAYNVR